ncbi:FAD-dependent oxidoreductase [archaeon]|nr:FAD-dependent oxidoreductase [archaeon]
MEKHDLVIVGAGPAGFSAAIYAARYKMDVLMIGQIPGGIASTAHDIRNYPGFDKISGMELMMKMIDQTKKLEVPIKQDAVIDIKKIDEGFLIKTSKEEILGKKIILATGTARRELGLSREKELTGKGVSYCATCDAGFYKDKTAAVVGGGDAALTAALLLAKFATKVYVIYRQTEFTKAEVSWVDEIKKTENIEVLFNEEVTELIGEERLEKVKLSSGKELELNGLFIEIGGTPNTKLAEELKLELENGSIVVDKDQATNVKGVFCAGDVTNRPFKQIITAAGDGATACYTAFKELRKEKAQQQ